MSYKDPFGQDPDRDENLHKEENEYIDENEFQEENMNNEKQIEDTVEYNNVPEYSREVSEPMKDVRDPRNEDAYIYRGGSSYEGGQSDG